MTKARLTHFPFWHADHCGFLMARYSVAVCGHVSCAGGSYSLLMRSNSHWHSVISEAAAEMFVSRLDERGRNPFYLLSRGSGEDKGGKNREGVFGVSWPALDCGPHGKAEERDRLWQRE